MGPPRKEVAKQETRQIKSTGQGSEWKPDKIKRTKPAKGSFKNAVPIGGTYYQAGRKGDTVFTNPHSLIAAEDSSKFWVNI